MAWNLFNSDQPSEMGNPSMRLYFLGPDFFSQCKIRYMGLCRTNDPELRIKRPLISVTFINREPLIQAFTRTSLYNPWCSVATRSYVQLDMREIQKTTTSFVYERCKTLRTRSAELIIAVNTPKASGLSPDLF